MFNQILVALDGSTAGLTVFERGVALAQLTGAALKLLHVLTYEDDGYSPYPAQTDFSDLLGQTAFERYLEMREQAQKCASERLRTLAEQARLAGVQAIEWAQYAGSPELAICKAASEWPADLIVVGRRGHSGFSELFLGSVSNYVLHHAPCSVLVLQTGSAQDALPTAATTEASGNR